MAYGAAMKFRTIPILAALLLAAPVAVAAPRSPGNEPPAKQTPAQASGKPIPDTAKPQKAATQKAAAKPRTAKREKPQPPLTVESLLAGSRAAANRGNTELALRLAQSAIVADPARPGSYVALGDLYARAGEDEYARSYYQAALGIDPSDTGALGAMAALDQPHNATAANADPGHRGP
jgi:tetratricopeptide (TPR) repeat protein